VLKVSGRVRGASGHRKAYVEVRRGGAWQRLAARFVHGSFRVTIDPRIPAFHGARVTKVRVVVPGVGRSRAIAARVRG
jgi:hypothetical protein